LTQIFVESGVDFEVAHLSVFMVWRWPYLKVLTLNGNTKSVVCQHSTFFLVCCFGADCPHPLCQSGKPPCKMEWFAGSPSLQTIPVPVADPSRPWGNL